MSYKSHQILNSVFSNPDLQFSIYPGHPVTVAYLITQVFENYDRALEIKNSSDYPAALSSLDIPGAGGNVMAAIELLNHLRNGISWEAAVKWADDYWTRCDSQAAGGYAWNKPDETEPDKQIRILSYQTRYRMGQLQADTIKPLLAEQSTWWILGRKIACKDGCNCDNCRTPYCDCGIPIDEILTAQKGYKTCSECAGCVEK